VKRAGLSFAAEVRGLAHYLQQPKGRLFQYTCDADLGDARCGVDLGAAAFTGTGTVLAASSQRRFTSGGLDAFADDWFTRGLLVFTSGPSAGLRCEVREHRVAGGLAGIELWQPLGRLPEPGETFTIRAGCDKHLATCRDKFANQANFRGFPHMPGNDFVGGYARRGG
jgi:uncharacterized phage protein (TIGR02218 family)